MTTRHFIGALALLVAACGSTDDGIGDEVVVDVTVVDVTVVDESTSDETIVDRGTPDAETSDGTAPNGCANVIDATIERGSGGYDFDATVLSADTGWDKYADAWVVRGPDGEVLGERVLTHPHENEQPFTRSLNGVTIPDGVNQVTIAAHDSVVGFCGEVVLLEVPRS